MKPFLFLSFLFCLTANGSQAQNLYELSDIQTIELQFEQSNWQNLLEQYYAQGQGQRLLATAIINGISFDSVGVRYKGNSSYNPTFPKKPLNIKLDYVLNQDYQGYTTLKLNNGFKDPSWCREVLGYWLLGHFMAAPQANYARLYINGTYYGLYTNVESINKSFVKKHFASDKDNPFFEGDPPQDVVPPPDCPPSQGASLNYLGENLSCYEARYQIKSDTGWSSLKELCYAVDAQQELIPLHMEIDRFLWMSVFNNLTINLDSYLGSITHNYYLFQRDNGRYVPIVWDLNECFGVFLQLNQGPPLSITQAQTLSPDANKDLPDKPLLGLLLNHSRYRKMYYAHYRAMLEHFFQNENYLAKAEELQNLIAQALQNDNHALYDYNSFQNNLYQSVSITGPGGNTLSIPGIQQMMEARTQFLQNLPEWQTTAPAFTNAYNISPANIEPAGQLWITTSLQNADSCWILYRYNEADEFNMQTMYDDGAHQDGAAGDGVFGVALLMGNTELQFAFYAENENAGTFLPYNATYGYYQLNLSADIAINELMASNATTQADPHGEYDDWVELFNNTNQLISLEGYHLSDDSNQPDKWTFPAGAQIEAQGYLVIWLDKDDGQQGLHANFKLSAGGEALYLYAPDGNLIDGVEFGPQSTDLSYARCPNGSGAFGILSPTFWADNNTACLTPTTEIQPEENSWSFYPNPVKDILYWQSSAPLSQPLEAQLYQLNGQLLKRYYLSSTQGQIDLQKLPKGVYFLFIREQNKVFKIVK